MLFWTGSFLRLRITQPLLLPLPPVRPEHPSQYPSVLLCFLPDFRCCYPLRLPKSSKSSKTLSITHGILGPILALLAAFLICYAQKRGQLRHKTWYNVTSRSGGGYPSGLYASGGRGGESGIRIVESYEEIRRGWVDES